MGKVGRGKWILHSGIFGMLFLFLLVSCGGNDGNTSPFTEFDTPVAEFSASPTTGNAPLTVAFSDHSTGGSVTLWFWDFGDGGTSTEQDPSHNYATAGTYTISLTVTGPNGSDTITKVNYITVTPFAQFSATPLSGNAPLDVQFTDGSTGSPTSWSWDFGDGSALDTNQDPLHTYNAVGVYTVTLTVNGPGGPDDVTRVDYISVGSAPPPVPVAGFSADNTTGMAPLTVQFTNESTGPIDTYSWDFGDGSALDNTQNPSHTYNAAGTYDVTLDISGPGGTDSLTELDYITVELLVVTDDFNRPDGPVGGLWVTSPNQGDVTIVDNALAGGAVTSGGAYYNAAFDNNQYSQARIAAMANVGVTVRMDNTVQSYYRFQVVNDNTASLGKYINGTFTELVPISGSFAADDIIRLEVSGSTLTAKQNGSEVATTDDSDLTGGYPGVRFFTGSPNGRLDDWEGGSLP